MKHSSLFGAFAVASILAFCTALAAPAGDPAATAAEHPAAKTTTHEVTATVVSTDVKAHTITLKDDEGKETTAKCMGNAAKELSTVKSGEKVTCTCKDNAKGEHLGVIAIKPAKS
jgi:hypothetical protein